MYRHALSAQRLARVLFYLAGLLILALGLTMNTKAGLGVSPIISISYSVSTIWGHNFGDMTLVLYSAFVAVEMVLHGLSARRAKAQGTLPQRPLAAVWLLDALQFPLSLLFTRFLNWFGAGIPDLVSQCQGSFWGTLPGRVLFLLGAIVCTGIGASLSLNARLIPNPGDGIVQAIADQAGKSVGLCKNCVDVACVACTAVLGLTAAGQPVGIGLGTLLAMAGVGRVIAVFNHFCFRPIATLSGLSLPEKKLRIS